MVIDKLEFELTFAPETKLKGKKSKKVVYDYHNYIPGTTKRIKSKLEQIDEELEAFDLPNEKRYDVNTKIFKIYDGVKYKGSVTRYDNQTKLCHIEYEDSEMEDMYRNEVKPHHHVNVNISPKKKRWKKKKQYFRY